MYSDLDYIILLYLLLFKEVHWLFKNYLGGKQPIPLSLKVILYLAHIVITSLKHHAL